MSAETKETVSQTLEVRMSSVFVLSPYKSLSSSLSCWFYISCRDASAAFMAVQTGSRIVTTGAVPQIGIVDLWFFSKANDFKQS